MRFSFVGQSNSELTVAGLIWSVLFFANVPLYALTATATRHDKKMIITILCMKDVKNIVGNIDRPNIFIEKQFREGADDDALERIILPIVEGLTKLKTNYPLTIIYLPLRWCGYAYNRFESYMGEHQYFPYGANPEPCNRLFAQYHSPQTQNMKDEILKQLYSANCKLRVVFATLALGMGVNIPNIRCVIHFGVPGSVRQYYQEIGRAGRDYKPARAILYYNNRDISSNRKGVGDDIRLCFVGLNLHLLILLYYFSLGIDLTLIDTFKYLGSNYEHVFA